MGLRDRGHFAAIGTLVCRVGPLTLLALSFGPKFVGTLTRMELYRPILIKLTLFFLGFISRKFYLVPQVCVSGTACHD